MTPPIGDLERVRRVRDIDEAEVATAEFVATTAR
jgi:hypothetical protein